MRLRRRVGVVRVSLRRGQLSCARVGGLGHLVELASAGVVLGREIPPAEDERLELDDVHQDIGVETLVAGRFFESSVIKLFLFECCRMQSIAFGRLPSVAIDCVRLLLAKSIPRPQAGGKAAPLEKIPAHLAPLPVFLL